MLVTPVCRIVEGRSRGIPCGGAAAPRVGASRTRALAPRDVRTGTPWGFALFKRGLVTRVDGAACARHGCGALGIPCRPQAWEPRGLAHPRPCCLTMGPALRGGMAEEGGGGGAGQGTGPPPLGAAWGRRRAGDCPAVQPADRRQACAVRSQPGGVDSLMARECIGLRRVRATLRWLSSTVRRRWRPSDTGGDRGDQKRRSQID